MAKDNLDFHTPKAHIIESDPQIVQTPQDSTDWGGSKKSMPKNIKNSMTLKHVGGDMTSGKKG